MKVLTYLTKMQCVLIEIASHTNSPMKEGLFTIIFYYASLTDEQTVFTV